MRGSRAYEKKRDEGRRKYRLLQQWRRDRVNRLLVGPYATAVHKPKADPILDLIQDTALERDDARRHAGTVRELLARMRDEFGE